MLNYNTFLILNIILLLLFYNYHLVIAKKINLFDYPDNKRKIHLKPVPLTGGILILALIILYQFNIEKNFNKNIYFIFFYSSFFIIGLTDDFFSISPKTKLILIFITSITFISFSQSMQISEIKIFFSDNYKIYYKSFDTIFFSAIILTSIVVVFNLIDGANGLAVTLFTIYILFFNSFLNLNPFLLLIILANIFFYFVINMYNKSFLGSSGNILISVLLYQISITTYNSHNTFDLIYFAIIFYLPYLDAVRIFFSRIANKKSPFNPDKSHLHHYLLKNKFFKKKYLLFYLTSNLIPLLIILNIKINTFLLLFLVCIYYFFIVYKLKKN